VEGWGLTRINKCNAQFSNAQGTAGAGVGAPSLAVVAVKAFQSNPSPLIQLKLLDSGRKYLVRLDSIEPSLVNGTLSRASSANHLAVLQVDQHSINGNSEEGQDGYKKRSILVASIYACVGFILMNFYAWWKVDTSNNFVRWALLVIGTLIGFAYRFCLFVQSTV
jgi:hypothetical protein